MIYKFVPFAKNPFNPHNAIRVMRIEHYFGGIAIQPM